MKKKCDLITEITKKMALVKKSINTYLTYDITNSERKEYKRVLESIEKIEKGYKKLNMTDLLRISEFLQAIEEKVKKDIEKIKVELANMVNNSENDISDILEKTNKKEKVEVPVIKEKKTTANKKNNKKKEKSVIPYMVGTAVGTLAIVGLVHHFPDFVKNEGKNLIDDNEPKQEQTTDITIEEPSSEVTVQTVDINNEESLYSYAQSIKDTLNCTISVEDIVNSIKLANYNALDSKTDFITSYEDVYTIMPNLGYLVANMGFGNIVLNNNYDLNISESYLKEMIGNVAKDEIDINVFSLAKENGSYNIFKVLDIIVDSFKTGENTKSMSKLYNEIFVNVTNTATICQNENNEFYFTLMALYNETSKTLKEDYLGPIYGDGEMIDGTYGHTCNQALREYYVVGNENNAFYSFVIDNYFLDKANVRQR